MTTQRIGDLDENVAKMLLTLGATLSAPIASPTKGKMMFPAIEGGTFRWQEFGEAEPVHIAEAPVFDVAESFIEYVNEFKRPAEEGKASTSQIFASAGEIRDNQPPKPKFIAALDWPEPGKPSRRTHNAFYAPRLDPFWEVWAAIHGAKLPQKDFGRFLEDHAPEIIEPSAAEMLEIATDFNIDVNLTFKSRKNLQNGLVNLEVKEASDGAGTSQNLKVPKQIKIRIPVFLGAQPQEILVNLRYDARVGQALTFTFDVHRIAEVYNTAFLLLAGRIGEAVGLKPKLGRPNV